MDLLIEKGNKRTYLSRYKVITTSFEESAPSVKRNNAQIQYRNGNVDFGGWNEAKTIDYVGYYRADDLEDEEYLRERIYALLSDPDGYYITQLKNDNDNSFERPGETSGDYFDKQVNRPSHKRFYVYASSLESELVGSYGGHVLYKISATFTTMKLPYGESVPRDLDVKPNVPYIGRNYIIGSNQSITMIGQNKHNQNTADTGPFTFSCGTLDKLPLTNDKQTAILSVEYEIIGNNPSGSAYFGFNTSTLWEIGVIKIADISRVAKTGRIFAVIQSKDIKSTPANKIRARLDYVPTTITIKFSEPKLEISNKATDLSPAPEDPGYNKWYAKTYYNTKNLVIPYAGTVPCNQLEQGFAIEFTAKEAGSNLKLSLNGIDFIANGNVSSGDVFKLSGYEYLRNGISIVKTTNKAYFKLVPGIANKISANIHGSIRILNFQNLYA